MSLSCAVTLVLALAHAGVRGSGARRSPSGCNCPSRGTQADGCNHCSRAQPFGNRAKILWMFGRVTLRSILPHWAGMSSWSRCVDDLARACVRDMKASFSVGACVDGMFVFVPILFDCIDFLQRCWRAGAAGGRSTNGCS